MAKKAKVPVGVHYDHGLTFEKCMEALKLGFTSVMYDCSTEIYEENADKVAQMVKICHAIGVTVEGELGHVGDKAGKAGIEKGLAAGAKTMMGLIPYEIEAMKDVVRDKITLFGSTNRA